MNGCIRSIFDSFGLMVSKWYWCYVGSTHNWGQVKYIRSNKVLAIRETDKTRLTDEEHKRMSWDIGRAVTETKDNSDRMLDSKCENFILVQTARKQTGIRKKVNLVK